MPLSPQDAQRYARQIALPEIGPHGQERLLKSSVLIVGAGGLGSPAAMYLAAAGVGRIGLLDFDIVDLCNLQRQILHSSSGVGKPKVESAAATLSSLNPSLEIEPHNVRLGEANAKGIFAAYDFIIDAADNFETKALIGETAWRLGKPHSYGGVREFSGQTMTVVPPDGPCVRCLLGRAPRSSGISRGPLGPVPGVIGSIQAAEAIKCLAGVQNLLAGSLLSFDALSMDFRKIWIKPSPHCPLCSRGLDDLKPK